MINVKHLHTAADLVGEMGDDETLIENYGMSAAVLQAFIAESDWRDVDMSGPLRDLDPLALAIGISIGVVAAERQHQLST